MENLIAQARWVIQMGSVLGLLSVGIGAFGAHSLRARLEAAGRMDTFETAVKYQFYHALALVLVGIITQLLANNPAALKSLNWSAYSFVAGTLIFSGSLYYPLPVGRYVAGSHHPNRRPVLSGRLGIALLGSRAVKVFIRV